MVIKLIKEKSVWEGFVGKHPERNFLHSWSWAQMHRRLGREVYPVGLYEPDLGGVALFIKEPAKRGPYLTSAGGPLLDWRFPSQIRTLALFARQLGEATGAWFVRARSQLTDTLAHRRLFSQFGWVPAPMHLTAETTWQLDLAPSPGELLAQMHKNHRYDIRKAERLGVRVEISRDLADIALFYQLQLQTAGRKHWVPFPQQYLAEEFGAFVKQDQALLFKAFYQQKLVAMALFIFYGQEAVYHHAVSRVEARQVSAAYAIIWRAINEAKKRQLKRLNFWGLAPFDKTNHRYAGMNAFKQGFGGYPVNYLPAHDLPVRPHYWLTYGFERLRKMHRGL